MKKDVDHVKAKEYLKRLKYIDTIINQKLQELSDLRQKMANPAGIDYSKDRVQASPSGDASFVYVIDKIIKLEKEINAEINKFIDERYIIINQIQNLNDSRYIKVLYKRYVEFKSFNVIAVELDYTNQYIRELHKNALACFQETYKILLKTYKIK